MSQNHTNIWKNCLEIIKAQLNQQSFQTWFEPIIPLQYHNNTLTIQLPSQFFYEWIEENYTTLLHNTIKATLGQQARLTYTVKEDTTTSPIPSSKPNTLSPQNNVNLLLTNHLNPAYTFENFITGESNQLTKSVAESIAQKPGKTAFNPTFIYGESGMGKTHLLQATIHEIKRSSTDLLALYTSSQDFTQQFVNAAFSQNLPAFKNRYKRLDLLAIDDIQDLAGKYKTQEALFYIFNDLHQSGKQIIMSSDCPPVALSGIQKRLLSRFKWGLTTKLHMPVLNTRISIIKNKLAHHNVHIENRFIEYIATSIETNVRDIEGVITSLVAHISLNNKPIDYNLVKSIIEQIVCKVDTELSLEYLQQTIADYHKISVSDLKSKSRKREVVLARQVAMYLIKEHTNLSLKTIGEHFGGKDHSTVIYAQKSVNNLLDTDRYFKTNFESLKEIIKRKANTLQA